MYPKPAEERISLKESKSWKKTPLTLKCEIKSSKVLFSHNKSLSGCILNLHLFLHTGLAMKKYIFFY